MALAVGILNELSFPARAQGQTDAEIATVFIQLARTMKAAKSLRNAITYFSAIDPQAHLVDAHTSLAAIGLSSAGLSRDAWRYIQQSRSNAGSSFDLDELPPEVEYGVGGLSAPSIGLAHFSRQLAISFDLPGWQSDSVVADLKSLSDDGTIGETSAVVPHASRAEHIKSHHAFLFEAGRPQPPTGSTIWEEREDRFPNIEFLEAVKGQLQGLGVPESASVDERLVEMQVALFQWDRSTNNEPAWASKVTPESQTRQRLCMFTDLDGVSRCFDMHARYTPLAGRIHFRFLSGSAPKIRVAYVGQKLGT